MMTHRHRTTGPAGWKTKARHGQPNMSALITVLLLLAWPSPGKVFSQADFYAGKTITIIQDSSPGGVGHLRTNAVIASLKKHITGNTTIVIKFIEWAGGRNYANYLFENVGPVG
jgi:hypothetical protein